MQRAWTMSAALGAVLVPATAVAAGGDARWEVPQCATLGVGASLVDSIGYEYRFPSSTVGPAVEGGYGYCGAFVEASLRLRFVDTADFFMLQPGVSLRVHTRSPWRSGGEAGVGLRLGYNYLNVTSTGAPFPGSEPPIPRWEPFDAFGLALGAGADARYWFDEKRGLFFAADVSWMIAGQAYGRDEVALATGTMVGGAVFRF